jgi:hypothetical protein
MTPQTVEMVQVSIMSCHQDSKLGLLAIQSETTAKGERHIMRRCESEINSDFNTVALFSQVNGDVRGSR